MHQSPPPHASVHWDDLRVFVAVADVQSFSAAARSLGVEPSTIGRRIKRLEDVLGLTLFERHADGLRPTAASKPLLQHAQDAARSIDSLVATAREQPSAGGRVRVACTAAMADLVLVPNMQSFLSEHPALRLDLETGIEFVDVSRGQADVALRSRRPREHGLVSRRLATMHFAPFATKAYAAAHGDDPPASWDWLLVRADVVETAWFENHLGVEPRLTMHSFKAQLDAVRQGLGVGLIATKAAAMFDDLVELALPGFPEPAPFELWLVTQQERRQQPHVRAVIDWLVMLVEAMA